MERQSYYTLLLSKQLCKDDYNAAFEDLKNTFGLTIKNNRIVKNIHYCRAFLAVVDVNIIRINKGFKELSNREMANILHVDHKTISNELNRISGVYDPDIAQKDADSKMLVRKSRSSKLTPEIISFLVDGYQKGKYAYELSQSELCKSHNVTESDIYYWSMNGNINLIKPRRINHYIRKNGGTLTITRKIQDRPDYINNRSEFGHYEADMVCSSHSASEDKGNQHLATFVERVSRLLIVFKVYDKSKDSMMATFIQLKAMLPSYAMQSVTVDRGREFSCAKDLEDKLNIQIFFCDAQNPQQKGAIENRNRAIRKHIPKRSFIEDYSNEQIAEFIHTINSKPMKILNAKYPYEVFSSHCPSRNARNIIERALGIFKK